MSTRNVSKDSDSEQPKIPETLDLAEREKLVGWFNREIIRMGWGDFNSLKSTSGFFQGIKSMRRYYYLNDVLTAENREEVRPYVEALEKCQKLGYTPTGRQVSRA